MSLFPQTIIPRTIPGLVVWGSADAINGRNQSLPAEDESVAQAADLAGMGQIAAQATGSAQPTFKYNIFGSKPALRFTAANLQALLIPGSTVLNITSSVTMYVVYKALSNPTNGAPFYKDVTGSGGNAPYSIDRGATGAVGAQFTNSVATTVTPGIAGDDINTSVVAEAYYDGTNVSIKKNAASANTTALTAPLRTTPAGALNIGCQKIAVSRFFDGYIAEWILFNQILSSENRLFIRNYLGDKYGIEIT